MDGAVIIAPQDRVLDVLSLPVQQLTVETEGVRTFWASPSVLMRQNHS